MRATAVEKALWSTKGQYITIQLPEACTAIDVTSQFVRVASCSAVARISAVGGGLWALTYQNREDNDHQQAGLASGDYIQIEFSNAMLCIMVDVTELYVHVYPATN